MVLDFGLINSGLFPESDAAGEGMSSPVESQIIWKDVGVGIIPIGGVVAWCKSLSAALPPLLPNYVECNGQVLSDGGSVLNGATIPNLNGAVAVGLKGRFLRGDSTSGTTQTPQNYAHTHDVLRRTNSGDADNYCDGGTGADLAQAASTSEGGTEARPYSYTVVWVMRIK